MAEERRFDFAKNAWVGDDFLTRRTTELPTPAAPPAAGRWTAPAQTHRRRDPLVAFALVGLAAPVIAYLASGAGALFLALLAVVVGLIVVRNRPRRPTHLHAAPDDLRLMEAGDDPEVCLVEVEIVYDDAPVGTDRGVAWFEGGALLFSGRRTSFAIGGEDVLPWSYYSEYGRERASALPDDAVPLRAPRPRTYLRLTPLDRHGEISARQARRFVATRREFRERPTPSSVPRQWPPFKG